jgi:hypothetical protein
MRKTKEWGMTFTCFNLGNQLGLLFAKTEIIGEKTGEHNFKVMYGFCLAVG